MWKTFVAFVSTFLVLGAFALGLHAAGLHALERLVGGVGGAVTMVGFGAVAFRRVATPPEEGDS